MAQEWSLDEVLIGLHEAEGVGWKTIKRIMAGGGLAEALDRRERDWREFGLNVRQRENLVRRLRPESMEAAWRKRSRAGVFAVTRRDPRYPFLLKQSPDQPPWVLYCIGRPELLTDRPAVAFVGTRLATAYGLRVAEDLAAACAERGLAVVSGMAKGIDGAAHRGAVNRAGGTIAVLASPADAPYPAENRALYRKISETGLIVSEMPLGTQLARGHFVLRNRIIAGLSLGTVVVEAGDSSGALITAKCTIDANRELFVVPGPITSPRSSGALDLLRQGAKAVMRIDDILLEFQHVLPPEILREGSREAPPGRLRKPDPAGANLTPDEARLYDLLLERPLSIDELSARSGLTFGLLHSVLLSLQIKRRIHQQPGSVYTVL
ncbi:DNA-processing protein DprA [Cohnella zeiphila]|uniref:DNA-protecting protein DprA n=1 Tax=Cohnella zeiphila TaxID=2761120 RepID=A0A7X0SMP6_9BACL|nr:DNA-processing protein DprA [Cohnella zeiphila]MBB6732838.1 DNA-protecting protein DprA [Cohnella zeiphila]